MRLQLEISSVTLLVRLRKGVVADSVYVMYVWLRTPAVPEEVTEELFWRRFPARVSHMVEREEQVYVHASKISATAKAVYDSEGEEVRNYRIFLPTQTSLSALRIRRSLSLTR